MPLVSAADLPDNQQYEILKYKAIPTIQKFHECTERIRCIVGPVGSGKTSGAAIESCYFIPKFLYDNYGLKYTRGVVVRNTYRELMDTTCKTIKDPEEGWFPNGDYKPSSETYIIDYGDFKTEVLFRACDRAIDVKKFKSLEITWYWLDESIEIDDDAKRMLKNRLGRFPKLSTWIKCIKEKYPDKFGKLTDFQVKKIMDKHPDKFRMSFGIETTNPPDVEHTTYSEFDWGDTPPPGPMPEGKAKAGHRGFWQPPKENAPNLKPGYYDDLREDYADSPDWADMYIDGKPGIIVKGKLVYHNFKRSYHVSQHPIPWKGLHLYRGWDNSGNVPACVICQVPGPRQLHVLKEFTHDKMNIGTFTEWVISQCNVLFPDAKFTDWADPAGNNEYPNKEGGFTSNAKIMAAKGVEVQPSEQNLSARLNAVDNQLAIIDGMLIDPGCIRLINGFMGGYCYPKIESTGEYGDQILKNRFSHIHDALQYVLVKLACNASNVNPYTRPSRTGKGRKVYGRK